MTEYYKERQATFAKNVQDTIDARKRGEGNPHVVLLGNCRARTDTLGEGTSHEGRILYELAKKLHSYLEDIDDALGSGKLEEIHIIQLRMFDTWLHSVIDYLETDLDVRRDGWLLGTRQFKDAMLSDAFIAARNVTLTPTQRSRKKKSIEKFAKEQLIHDLKNCLILAIAQAREDRKKGVPECSTS